MLNRLWVITEWLEQWLPTVAPDYSLSLTTAKCRGCKRRLRHKRSCHYVIVSCWHHHMNVSSTIDYCLYSIKCYYGTKGDHNEISKQSLNCPDCIAEMFFLAYCFTEDYAIFKEEISLVDSMHQVSGENLFVKRVTNRPWLIVDK